MSGVKLPVNLSTWRLLAATTVIIGGVILITMHRAAAMDPQKPTRVLADRADWTEPVACPNHAILAHDQSEGDTHETDGKRYGEVVAVCE